MKKKIEEKKEANIAVIAYIVLCVTFLYGFIFNTTFLKKHEKRISKIEKVMPTGQYANQTLATTCYVENKINILENGIFKLCEIDKKTDKKTEREVVVFFGNLEHRILSQPDYDVIDKKLKKQKEFFGDKKWKIKEKEDNRYFLIRGKTIVSILSSDYKLKGEKVKVRPYLDIKKCSDCGKEFCNTWGCIYYNLE